MKRTRLDHAINCMGDLSIARVCGQQWLWMLLRASRELSSSSALEDDISRLCDHHYHDEGQRLLSKKLTHAVVAQPHVVPSNVVLADVVTAGAVELEGIRIVPDAVVEPPNLKCDILQEKHSNDWMRQ